MIEKFHINSRKVENEFGITVISECAFNVQSFIPIGFNSLEKEKLIKMHERDHRSQILNNIYRDYVNNLKWCAYMLDKNGINSDGVKRKIDEYNKLLRG